MRLEYEAFAYSADLFKWLEHPDMVAVCRTQVQLFYRLGEATGVTLRSFGTDAKIAKESRPFLAHHLKIARNRLQNIGFKEAAGEVAKVLAWGQKYSKVRSEGDRRIYSRNRNELGRVSSPVLSLRKASRGARPLALRHGDPPVPAYFKPARIVSLREV